MFGGNNVEGMHMQMGSLGLASKYEGRVQLCFEAAEKLIPGSEIYLFGSYAENQIFSSSTLELLVIVGDNCLERELRTLSWEVEDLVCTISDEAFPFEITVLSTSLYNRCCKQHQAMKIIAKRKINLRQVRWIDK